MRVKLIAPARACDEWMYVPQVAQNKHELRGILGIQRGCSVEIQTTPAADEWVWLGRPSDFPFSFEDGMIFRTDPSIVNDEANDPRVEDSGG